MFLQKKFEMTISFFGKTLSTHFLFITFVWCCHMRSNQNRDYFRCIFKVVWSLKYIKDMNVILEALQANVLWLWPSYGAATYASSTITPVLDVF